MGKIIVTGGAGFIGSHIVDALLAAGHLVEVIDDLSSGRRENLPVTVPLHVLDIRSEGAREVIARVRPDTVVHAAAQMSVRLSMEDPTFDTAVNVTGLVNIISALRRCRSATEPAPFCVFLSTGGAIYGEQETFPATEDHRIMPASVYGLSKRVGELYLEFWTRELGLPFAALRLANVYGPRQNPHGEAGVVAIFNQKLLRGETPTINGSGDQTRDFIYVGDVARAVTAVVTERVSGTFNIGTGRETSVNALYTAICRAVGRDPAPKRVPAKAGEQLRSVIDASRATHTFGWRPEVSLDCGLEATTAWFREAENITPGGGTTAERCPGS
jgi:UDP-glucose 4-epimerase